MDVNHPIHPFESCSVAHALNKLLILPYFRLKNYQVDYQATWVWTHRACSLLTSSSRASQLPTHMNGDQMEMWTSSICHCHCLYIYRGGGASFSIIVPDRVTINNRAAETPGLIICSKSAVVTFSFLSDS